MRVRVLLVATLLGIARLEDAPVAAGDNAPEVDPFAGHERLTACAKLEEESEEEDAADDCLRAVRADDALPCEVRALALRELALGSSSKAKHAMLREATDLCPHAHAARVTLARSLAKRAGTRAEVLPLLEAGLPLARSRQDASVLYHNIGMAHRVHGNWESGVNALRVALDLAPTDKTVRTDMLEVLREWQAMKLNQTDLENAPIFVKPFNKKGVRPFRLPAETSAELKKGKGRVVRAQRVELADRRAQHARACLTPRHGQEGDSRPILKTMLSNGTEGCTTRGIHMQ